MGDIADMMLDGTPPGYPRQCKQCRLGSEYAVAYPRKCKHCNKILRSQQSEHDHLKAKHSES